MKYVLFLLVLYPAHLYIKIILVFNCNQYVNQLPWTTFRKYKLQYIHTYFILGLSSVTAILRNDYNGVGSVTKASCAYLAKILYI